MQQLMLKNLLETITNRIEQNHGMIQESCESFADNYDAVHAKLVHQLSRHQLSSRNQKRAAVQEQTPLNNHPAGLEHHRQSQHASHGSELSFDYNQASFRQALHTQNVYPFRIGSSQELTHQQKKRLHPDAPCAPCASGGPGAQNVNSRSGCAVFYWVLVDRGPWRPDAPDATKDSEGTQRRKVLQTQKGSPDATR